MAIAKNSNLLLKGIGSTLATCKSQAKAHLEARAEEAAGLQEYRPWIKENLRIRDKDGNLIPMVFNPMQEKMNAIYDEAKLKRPGRPVHIITLKARQHGISTWWQSRCFERIYRRRYTSSLVLAHDDKGSRWIFRMSVLFNKYHPEGRDTDHSSAQEILYSAPHTSGISVQIAHKFAGSGQTVQYLHISELSKWVDPATTMLSVMQAAASADTVIESTANGEEGQGKYFADMWHDAKAGRNDYIPVFLPWFANPLYSIEDTDPDFENYWSTVPGDPTLAAEFLAEEEELKDLFDLSIGQLTWRRYCIRTLCNNTVDDFRQEYPATEEEAFLKVEGQRAFSVGICRIRRLACVDPIMRGRLEWHDKFRPKYDTYGMCSNMSKLKVVFTPDRHGPVKVWRPPPDSFTDDFSDERYLIPADVAQGVEGGDNCSAIVLDRRLREVSVSWHEHMASSKWGECLAMLSYWFYKAYVVPEINGIGQSTLDKLCALTNSVWTAQKFMPGSPYVEGDPGKYGWWTGANKEHMIGTLDNVINEQLWFDPEKEFWTEALSVVKNPQGRTQTNGKDRVMCRAIGAMIDRHMTPQVATSKDVSEPRDYSGKQPTWKKQPEEAAFKYTPNYDGKDWRTSGLSRSE